MPNTENINRLIDWIESDRGQHLRMTNWYTDMKIDPGEIRDHAFQHPNRAHQYRHCSTAFCLGGHIDYILQRDSGLSDKEIYVGRYNHNMIDRGSKWLEIDWYDADDLFKLGGVNITLDEFDTLEDDQRADLAIAVLTHLRDHGEVSWRTAFREVGINPSDVLAYDPNYS